MENYITIYVGQDDEGNDTLILEQIIGGKSFEIEETGFLNLLSEGDFILELGNLLNTASIFVRELGLRLRVDVDEIQDEIWELDLSEDCVTNSRLLIKEVLEQKRS